MSKFIKGQIVKFYRNTEVNINSVPISAVVTQPSFLQQNNMQSYIIEYVNGWTPNYTRAKSFELDITKKYLFVSENELTAI